MSTPTDYDLEYEDACEVEQSCDDELCADSDKFRFTNRRRQFCRDVVIQETLNVQQSATMNGATVIPAEITVGGLKFKPTVINTISGPHLVLAVY